MVTQSQSKAPVPAALPTLRRRSPPVACPWTRLVSLAALLPSLIAAAELHQFEMVRTGNHYQFSIDATLEAAPRDVWRVLTDYRNLVGLTPAIRESEVLADAGPGEVRIRTVTRLCALLFCKNVRQVQRIREPRHGEFEAVAEAQGSDLAYGYAHWRVGGGLRGRASLTIRFDMEPAFWVPPLLGPLVVEMALERETRSLLEGIEQAVRKPDGT